jgi:hypothetical protein
MAALRYLKFTFVCSNKETSDKSHGVAHGGNNGHKLIILDRNRSDVERHVAMNESLMSIDNNRQ